MTIEVEISRKCAFLFEPHRYKVLYGGRGAGKSYAIARALLIDALQNKLRILCTRQYQASIKDSVHKLFKDQIKVLGFSDFFEVLQTEIRGANGSEFIFSGIEKSIDSFKSKEGIDKCWVEEADTVTAHSWNILIPTIRKTGSEIYVSYNPILESDETHQKFVVNKHPRAKVVKLGWEDNEWISQELIDEKDHLYSVDAESAAHVWGGETIKFTKEQILADKIIVQPFATGDDSCGWFGPYQGADWGFAQSPTVLIRAWTHEHLIDGKKTADLLIEKEAFKVGAEITDTPELFDKIQNARKYVTRSDPARPETISHMQKNGYPLVCAAKKGPGSVEDGIVHLRGFNNIIIHPECTDSIKQLRLYKWKKDPRSGDILPVPIKKNDDVSDAIRYAVEPLMLKKRIAHSGYQSATKKKTSPLQMKSAGGFRSKTGGIF